MPWIPFPCCVPFISLLSVSAVLLEKLIIAAQNTNSEVYTAPFMSAAMGNCREMIKCVVTDVTTDDRSTRGEPHLLTIDVWPR